MSLRALPVQEERHEAFVLSTDPHKLDVSAIHAFLTTDSYWAAGIALDTVRRAIDHSICAGLYQGERQVGFARLVTDTATFAWLADVYVLPELRGRKLGVALVDFTLRHPVLAGMKRVMLGTRDAHDLYRRFGFEDLGAGLFLEKRSPDPYGAAPKE